MIVGKCLRNDGKIGPQQLNERADLGRTFAIAHHTAHRSIRKSIGGR
jgi:hypothetical protein